MRRSKRFNITGATILDCDGPELLLDEVSDSRVSDCLLRDDRGPGQEPALKVQGGSGNQIVDNVLGTAATKE